MGVSKSSIPNPFLWNVLDCEVSRLEFGEIVETYAYADDIVVVYKTEGSLEGAANCHLLAVSWWVPVDSLFLASGNFLLAWLEIYISTIGK